MQKTKYGEGNLNARVRRLAEKRWMKRGKLAAILLVASVIAGCGSGSSTPVAVTISPAAATVVRTGTQQFSASVVGISNTLVTWDVCNAAPTAIATGSSSAPNIVMPTGCVPGGNTTLGAITTTGLYTGPAILPPNSQVSVVAISQGNTSKFAIVNVTIDSGVRVSLTPTGVTIGTLEQFQFSARVTGATNTAVSWSVNGTANGSPATGTITPAACTVPMPITPTSSNPVSPGTSFGCYTAPATPQSAVSITATAAADNKQFANARVDVLAATDPSFSMNRPLEPTATVEGAAQQEIYLFGTDFFSTNQVLVNGAPVPTVFVNSATLRAIIPEGFFSGPAPLGLPVTVRRQNGDVTQPVNLGVRPMRPAVIASSPESFPTSTPSATLSVNGGYFSSSTQASSQGTALPVTVVNSRQLQVGLSGAGFFATPGLLPILIQNSDVPSGSPSVSSLNVAIAPSPSNIPTSANPPIAVGTQPVAVGIDSSLGIAAVVDQGSRQVSLLNLDTNSAAVNVSVGKAPTSVGVDDILHLAAVVNSVDNSLSIVNLQTQAVSTVALPSNPTGSSPAPSPYAIGVNPLTHRAVIAYSSSNIATVFDLSANPPKLVCTLGGSNPTMPNNCSTISGSNTRPVSTGPAPSIVVEPQLNWAVVTPGGSGTISIIEMGAPATANQVARVPNVIASFNGTSTSIRGAAINTETEEGLLVDPNSTQMSTFSVLDQSVRPLSVSQGFVAVAINPLTDIGVAVNSGSSSASVIDLRSLKLIGNSISVGASPQAVAIDPGKNVAVIANAGGNSVSILSLGAIRTPQITEVSPPIAFAAPSASALTVTVNGFGFSSGAQVRLDGVAVPTSVSSNGRQAIATVPSGMLSSPRRFTLDVVNSGSSASNVRQFLVIGAVPIGLNPIGVAIDPDLNEALVTSQGPINSPAGTCAGTGSVSVVNLAAATVTSTMGVGSCPEGVAVLPRSGLSVIANNGSANATVFDYVNNIVTATVATQLDPLGVAIAPDSAQALVANSSSNTVTTFTVSSGSLSTASGSIPVDQVPYGVGVDSIDNLAVVTSSNQNNVDVITLGSSFLVGRVSGFDGPTDAAFDPITDAFLVADSLANQVGVIDAKAAASGSGNFAPFRVGINPTALAYNFQSGTGVTFNQASNTFSIFNFLATNPNSQLTIQAAKVEIVLPIGGSAGFSVAIDPLTNMATVVDQANGRLLLVPLP